MSNIMDSTQHMPDAAPPPDARRVLNDLNALDLLAERTYAVQGRMRLYGPRVFQAGSAAENGQTSASVRVWYLRRGANAYKTLTVYGIWAHPIAEGVQVTVGSKQLDYAAPIFNPEAFFALIQQEYNLYYVENEQPPTPNEAAYVALYTLADRLIIRRDVERAVIAWANNLA